MNKDSSQFTGENIFHGMIQTATECKKSKCCKRYKKKGNACKKCPKFS